MFLIPERVLVLNIYNIIYVLKHVFFSMFDRFLVEQLSKVNPNCMNSDEQLAFWINLYNALIMHVSTTCYFRGRFCRHELYFPHFLDYMYLLQCSHI